MDFAAMVSEFVDDLLGARSAYGLTELSEPYSPLESAALTRFRHSVLRALVNDGWRPPEGLANEMAADEHLFDEGGDATIVAVGSIDEDRAAIRARASRVRAEANEMSDYAAERRSDSVELHEEIAQMRKALESRAVIEQAKGIAMERYSLESNVAWSWLVRTSQQRNVKLREIAEELVASAGNQSSSH